MPTTVINAIGTPAAPVVLTPSLTMYSQEIDTTGIIGSLCFFTTNSASSTNKTTIYIATTNAVDPINTPAAQWFEFIVFQTSTITAGAMNGWLFNLNSQVIGRWIKIKIVAGNDVNSNFSISVSFVHL